MMHQVSRAALRSAIVLSFVIGHLSFAPAQDPTVAPLMRLLESGRLPAERQPQVVERICQRGGPEELAFVLQKVLEPAGFTPRLRVQSLTWLAEAAGTRKVKPTGDLSKIEALLQPAPSEKNHDLLLAAIKAASTWQVAEATDEVSSLARDDQSTANLRRAAIAGLARLGSPDAEAVLIELAEGKQSSQVRMLATAGLAGINTDAAAQAAANVLASASPNDDPDAMLNSFFLLKEGSAKLTAALQKAKLEKDVAKRALRYMYSVGHDDADLSALLSERAGIAADVPPPTQEEALVIAAEVAAKGDAVRGEQVFRRADVSCVNCHAIHRAGGQVGPDLSNVGRISPVDYIVTSVLNPNQAIKEAYVTRIIETVDGKLVQGVAVDRDDARVVLRTADGKTLTIPTADIDTEEEGRSLMPQGLTKFLTHQEFLDLAKFVSELGKEGGKYLPPATPAIQRWRVLREPSEELLASVPNVEQVREFLFDTPEEQWLPAYGMVSGELPLRNLVPGRENQPLYLLGEVDVVEEGEVTLQVESSAAVQGWLGATPLETKQPFTTTLPKGRHKLAFRVEASPDSHATLRVSLAKPAGSTAQFDIVAGQ